MFNFSTTITRTRARCGLELLAVAGDTSRDEDSLAPEEVFEFEVQVDYEPGWFAPGKFSGPPENCYPDEGEDPEILRVVTLDEDEEEVDIIDSLTREEYSALVAEAAEAQFQAERDAQYDAAESLYDDWVEAQEAESLYGDC